MGHRILPALLALSVLASGFAGVATAATGTAAELSQGDGAAVTFENQATGGDTVVVDSVRVPEGGYVTIHDASLADGEALGSVVGTSAYLTPGTHENVTVTLTDDVSDGAYTAMVHQETDGDRTYEFVASNGETDTPYVATGNPVTDSADIEVSATVSMADQPTDGESVVVDRVALSEGGFVTIHDSSVTRGETVDSIRGTSAFLEAGVHEDVRVELSDPVTENTTLVPMAHQDTDGDGAYSFEASGGDADGPYTANGSAVTDTATVTLASAATVSLADQTAGGTHVVVDSVFLPEGGFVTVHDESLTQGDTFGSVRGTSAYLGAGYHTEVTVPLDAPVANDSALLAMPHRDSDGNQNYTFVESDGGADGPYTADGDAVTDAGNVTVSAAVRMPDQTSDGRTVTVDRVDLAEGGFVVIHDATLLDGNTVDSVVGSSAYLPAGVHEDITITLDERLTSGQTLVAMPHRDSDGNQNYTFVESDGGADGPYTDGDGAVTDTAETTVEASIAFDEQTVADETVTVRSVTLQDGGFVTVHGASLQDGAVFDSVRGTSAYLGPGTHENVTVTLDEPVAGTTTLIPMAHRDTDGDERYTFLESEGVQDGPYLGSGGAVVASAQVTSEDGPVTETESTGEMNDADTATESTGGSGPGFTAVTALLALVAAALLTVRRTR